MRERLAGIGMAPVRVDELGAVRDLAARLISPDIAGEEALRRVHRRTGYGFYVAREAGVMSAVMALVLLNGAGLAAVQAETFDPLAPDPAHAVAPPEAPQAVYGWGIAAATRESAAVLVASNWAVLDVIPRPFFVRAATEAGRRMLTQKMSFVPYPGSTTGLLWWDAAARQRRAA
ncbi:MAG TPA: hypothetical protein VFX95_08685 [Caulobacteraceae bacterium]|nr:hypothetical protein [Caulobacteraceae bacterium]